MVRSKLPKAALAAAALCWAAAAGAQLVPPVGDVLDTVGRIGERTIDGLDDTVAGVDRAADRLVRERLSRLRGYARRNREAVELSGDDPAVRGRVIAVDPGPEVLGRARDAGFRVLAEESLDDLGVAYVTLAVPGGLSVDEALERLRAIGPGGTFAADHIHFQTGAAPVAMAMQGAAQGHVARPAIGIVDGGAARHPALAGGIEQRGFARGAPRASAHGTAVASLAAGSGTMRGGAPGVALLVADIYGDDPAGGSATAVARAIGWMAGRRVPVISLSLVGPANPLVERAIRGARARGIQFVAPVGNDGPAAPPAYPASYPGVIAVTGVDRRNRPLPEAGRALHLDYAAPGADMRAAAPGGRLRRVRGTSFAAPLVAGRLAATGSVRRLDAEAVDLGEQGPDEDFGRGLICGECRNSGR